MKSLQHTSFYKLGTLNIDVDATVHRGQRMKNAIYNFSVGLELAARFLILAKASFITVYFVVNLERVLDTGQEIGGGGRGVVLGHKSVDRKVEPRSDGLDMVQRSPWMGRRTAVGNFWLSTNNFLFGFISYYIFIL